MSQSDTAYVEKSLGLSLQNIYETLAISWPTLVDAARRRIEKPVLDARLTSWAKNCVDNAEMRVVVHGREQIVPGRTYVVMSNHQSLYDIPVLFYALGANLRMITKKELFRLPVFGKALELAGFIKIDRGDRESAKESLAAARQLLATGTSVWIAPEGTRSKTGELLPFKKGGFHLALEADLPILPVTLRGTRDALRAKGVRSITGANVEVTVHAPIDPKPYKAEGKAGRDRLMRDVRAALQEGL